MAVGPLRGSPNPAIKPLAEKPAEQPKTLLQKAVDGVLKAGQHLVMPARTGLAHFADHFDARLQPDYDKVLKGETKSARSEDARAPAEVAAAEDSATAAAAEQAMAMFDALPPIVIPPPIPTVRAAQTTDVEELQEPEERHREPPDDGQEASSDNGRDDGPDEDFIGAAPAMEPRNLELQAGLFTLDEGSIDVRERRLCTLEAFLDGDVPFVSCAVDLQAIPDGAELRIPSLDAAAGRPVRLRAVHQNARTAGVGSAYLEVCVSDPEVWRAALERIVAVRIG